MTRVNEDEKTRLHLICLCVFAIFVSFHLLNMVIKHRKSLIFVDIGHVKIWGDMVIKTNLELYCF